MVKLPFDVLETASSEEKPTSEKSPLTMDVPPKSLPPSIPPTLGLPSPDWSEASDSLESDWFRDSLMSFSRSRLICAVTVVFSKPVFRAVVAACLMDRPMVAAMAMMVTMMMTSMLRPLFLVTLFHAFFTTNMMFP